MYEKVIRSKNDQRIEDSYNFPHILEVTFNRIRKRRKERRKK